MWRCIVCNSTVGFVEFSDHKSAAEAREQFNNFKFSHNDDHGISYSIPFLLLALLLPLTPPCHLCSDPLCP